VGIYNRGQLSEYYRAFTRIRAYLAGVHQVDTRSLNAIFIQGFGKATRRKIEHRLSITQPNHHPDDPYAVDVVKEATEFLLVATMPVRVEIKQEQSYGGYVPQAAVQPKTEPSNISALVAALKNLPNSITALQTLVNAIQTGSCPANDGRAMGNTAPQYNVNRGGPQLPFYCFFCGEDDHLMTRCAIRDQYLASK
jgi:hypothetical protein